ncbi:MAG TPA: hypothetical protein PLT26_05200 [Anaerolineaceae bacterium]|nr:hypothetical protein [Anaerolineaceae bacterium]HQH84939.1 hypothetical protein [Anaerolineaceae bacterium]
MSVQIPSQEDEPRAETAAESPAPRRWRPRGVGPAFWTLASIFSLIVNVILIVVVLVLARNLFALKALVGDGLITPLYQNFVLMDEASIKRTITVDSSVPAQFDLELDTDTMVTLTEDTYIEDATVTVYTGGLYIDAASADIILPAGAELPIHLAMTVPVDQTIPVNLDVEVDIPLNETELHTPFVGLQNVVAPYHEILSEMPSTWEQAICGPTPSKFCQAIIP